MVKTVISVQRLGDGSRNTGHTVLCTLHYRLQIAYRKRKVLILLQSDLTVAQVPQLEIIQHTFYLLGCRWGNNTMKVTFVYVDITYS